MAMEGYFVMNHSSKVWAANRGFHLLTKQNYLIVPFIYFFKECATS